MVSQNSKVVDSLKDASSDLSKSRAVQLKTNAELKEELNQLELENTELQDQVAAKRKESGSLKDTLKEISEEAEDQETNFQNIEGGKNKNLLSCLD